MKRLLIALLVFNIIFACGCGKTEENKKTDEMVLSETNFSVTPKNEEISIFSYKPDTFCPILSENEANIRMLGIIYESLILLGDEFVAMPNLAEEWSVSEKGLEWRIKLRDGVKWHDGSQFKAADVVYTVNKIKENQNSNYFYNVATVSKVYSSGENTVLFTLDEPNPNFINLLYFPIIKNNSVSEELGAFRPVGTGAFRFEDRNEGNIYYLIRNNDWWGGKAASECIKVKMLPDKNTALYAFASGSIDLTGVDSMDWGKFVDPECASFVKVETPIYNFIGINHKNELLKMQEVRRVISYSIDREKILNEVAMGYGEVVNVPLRSSWFLCENKNGRYVRNTKAAEEILLKNGWEIVKNKYVKRAEGKEHRLKLSILINEDNSVRENIAQIVKKNLEDFGISVNIVKVSYGEYEARIATGKYDIFIGSYLLSPDLNTKHILGEGNWFNFADDEMRSVTEKLNSETEPEKLKSAYTELMNLFEQNCPIIGLYFEDTVMIYTNQLEGKVTPSYFHWYEGIEKLQKGVSENEK